MMNNHNEFIYIDNSNLLEKVAAEWKNAKEIGVDLECENNLHHYGVMISLIQISTKDKHWIVDVIALKQINPLLEVFEDLNVQKIFHDVSFDFRILFRQFSCQPKNVYDTQLACLLLGKKNLGLTEILANYFGVEKNHRFQKADWTRRPISKEMISYATNDTRYLIKLRDILNEELKQLGRQDWVKQESAEIENRDFSYPEPDFFNMKGLKLMQEKPLAILSRLYRLREKLAEMVDRPVHFIINNRLLISISLNPPNTLYEWENMRGVHPIVRREAKAFFEEVNSGKNETLRIPREPKKRYTLEQREKIIALIEKRDKIAEKLGISGYLILNNDQMQNIALTGSIDSLRQWQKSLLGF